MCREQVDAKVFKAHICCGPVGGSVVQHGA